MATCDHGNVVGRREYRRTLTERERRHSRRVNAKRFFRPIVESLEARCVLAFSVISADLFANSGLRLVVDFDQSVNTMTVEASDLVIDGVQTASAANVLDADTVEFLLPSLADGSHSTTLAANSILDTSGTGLTPFSNTYVVASTPQLTVKHNPRLQPGNSPLASFAGGELDRVDILWQTIPGGAGTQDSFAVQYRPTGSTGTWQSATLNADIVTGVENRVVRSASITGLNWNSDYEYRVRHLRGSVIVVTYQDTFHTRLQAGDATPFSFSAYGDSASGTATGFRQVQSRINQINPAFTVLLGDNVYSVGSHQESDARFDPVVNPEAAAWMSSHIDYLGLGNHDVGTGSGLPSEQNYSVPIPVAGVTASAAPPATERTEHNFSWDYGNVHFVTFDTNSLADTARLDALLNWVVADLNASTARWKIVYGHHPLAGVPDKSENPGQNYYQQVVNRLKAAGVDMFMTGHSHTYSWTYPLTGQINGTATHVDHGHDDQFIAGEGLTQLVSGLGGVEIRPGTFTQFPFVAEGFTSATPIPARLGFSKVDVTPNVLTVSYVAADNGAVIDSFTITKDAAPQTVAFQQGANGYTGTTDTYLHQNTPTTNFAASVSLKVDNDDPAGTGLDAQTLLRFDNLFGSGNGQIPANAILRSATLQLQVTNGSVNNMNLHRMLQTWNATDTWNSRTNGVQTDGVEAVATPDTSSGQTQVGSMSFNVLPSLQAWQAAPTTNLGWALIPTGTDGVDFHSSEGATKPKLIVTYVLNNAPNDPPVAVNDSATTTGNIAATISVLSNDTDPNGNPLTITSVTTPTNGSVVINAGNTVTYTPALGYFGPDSFSYSISDGQGGTATASVNLTVVASTSFQQGAAGYTGTIDTFLQQNATTTNNATAISLNVDSDDPVSTGLDVQTLLRFDNLFGNGAGQIPTNATLHSATLQLQVTNAGASMNLHRMLANWSAADTWASTTNGIQNDGVEAVVAADVSSGGVAVGSISINVLPSLQAWRTAPATNWGWVLLPTGTDGVDFDSSEGTVKPKLIVTYMPASNAPPTAGNDSATTDEDRSIVIAVLSNDSDSDGGSLSVTSTTTPLHGTAVINGNGTISYSPAANYFGADSFSYSLSDGQGGTATGTVSVSVASVNDLPTAVNDSATTDEDTSVVITVLSNDSDSDGGSLSVTSTTTPLHGTAVINGNGTISYSPAANYFGADSFSYSLSDGQGGTATGTVSVSVTSVNDLPIVVNDTVTTNSGTSIIISVLANDSDIDGNPLTVQSVTQPANGTVVINIDNRVTFTPVVGFTGATNFTYTASDGQGGTATASVNVTVNPVATAKFFVVDNGVDDVFQYTASGSVFLNHNLAATNLNPQGVVTSLDGSTVWVLDGNKRIFVYNSTGTLLGSWTTTSPKSPTGITTNGTDLWIVDKGNDRVYFYAGAAARRSGSAVATSSFALASGNTTPEGITTDGTKLWVVNSASTDRVFVYTTNGVLQGSWTIGNTTPTGLTIDPSGASQSIWIVDNGTDRIYEYTNARSRTSGSQPAANSFALGAGNTSPQDVADPRSFSNAANNLSLASPPMPFKDNQLAALYSANSLVATNGSSQQNVAKTTGPLNPAQLAVALRMNDLIQLIADRRAANAQPQQSLATLTAQLALWDAVLEELLAGDFENQEVLI